MTDGTPYLAHLVCLELGLGPLVGTTGEPDQDSVIYEDSRLTPYLGELREGGTVLDQRVAITARPGLAFIAPMLDATLPGGEVVMPCLPEHDTESLLNAWAVAMGADYEEPAPGEPFGLSTVGLDVYTAWWRERGARVGRREGDLIAWEDGERQAVPEPAFRARHPGGQTRSSTDEWDADANAYVTHAGA